MAEDEGRMLGSEEARVRRRLASISKKDTPKPFLFMERDPFGLVHDKKDRRSFDKKNPDLSRRFSGFAGTKVRGVVENAVGIEARYTPAQKRIKVLEAYPIQSKGKNVDWSQLESQHKELSNKMLPKPLVKKFVTKAAKMFGGADELVGARYTGVRAKAADLHIAKAEKTGNFDMMERAADKAGEMRTQRFDLKGIRKRIGKLGKIGKVAGLGLAAYDVMKNLRKE